jgi:hypothetical protein
VKDWFKAHCGVELDDRLGLANDHVTDLTQRSSLRFVAFFHRRVYYTPPAKATHAQHKEPHEQGKPDEFTDRAGATFISAMSRVTWKWRQTTRDGEPALEWSWNGNAEMDPTQGQGWAVVKGHDLHGMPLQRRISMRSGPKHQRTPIGISLRTDIP